MEVAVVDPATKVLLCQAESEFISFCQEVARKGSDKLPYWSKNLDLFERVFVKFRDNKNCQIPVRNFVSTHRADLEKPILEGDIVNDHWLAIDSAETVPEVRNWVPVKPRGVFLPTDGSDDWTHSIPLAEVYSACHDISKPEMKTLMVDLRKSFSGVTLDCVPVKFLHLFYKMLVEVEPDNTHFAKNLDICNDLMTPAPDMLTGVSEMFSSMMTPGSKAADMMSQFTSGFTPDMGEKVMEGFGKFTQNKDLSGLMEAFAPIIKSPGMQNLMSTLSGMMPAAAAAGASAAADASAAEENVSDQD